MIIRYDNSGELIHHKIGRLLEIELSTGEKFRLRPDGTKLRLMTQDGYLVLEPVASNAILIDQKDDV